MVDVDKAGSPLSLNTTVSKLDQYSDIIGRIHPIHIQGLSPTNECCVRWGGTHLVMQVCRKLKYKLLSRLLMDARSNLNTNRIFFFYLLVSYLFMLKCKLT